MISIILCGGSGTRLWPVSRKELPKQFVKLFYGKSLFQMTVERNLEISEALYIVVGESQYFLALDQLEEIGAINKKKINFLLESVGRNTAAAIAITCMDISADQNILMVPSDHLIKDSGVYKSNVMRGCELAEDNNLVTYGISPSYPETGYGYIHARGEDVLAFKEKPSFKTASDYINSGEYLWNSGMFCFKSKVFLNKLKEHSKDIFEASSETYKNRIEVSDNQFKTRYEDMIKIPDISVDYAVMEKADNVKVVYGEFDWNDVGSFKSIFDIADKDSGRNSFMNIIGEKENSPIMINSQENLVIGGKRQIAMIGGRELLVVDTDDALLITDQSESQKVKNVVEILKKRNSDLPYTHNTVIRPWGSYAVLEKGGLYKIKKIVVKPGKRLSLQKHYHRNEHWIVVKGTAKVSLDGEEFLLRQNESTFIKMGSEHRLENPGNIELVIIEAQVGEYTGEDDIVRLNDDFNRDIN